MSRAAPRLGLAVLALLMAGAVWLYLVRGGAMLLDLQAMFCF